MGHRRHSQCHDSEAMQRAGFNMKSAIEFSRQKQAWLLPFNCRF
jgi:hypothetical protein